MENLLISSMGLITAVGRDAVTAAASIRAGISRVNEVTHYKVLDEEENEMYPLAGYPIRGVTDGMSARARWLTMSILAFEDLVKFGDLPSSENKDFWRKTGLILVTPILDGTRFMFNPECQPKQFESDFPLILLDELNYPVLEENHKVISVANTGGIQAIAESDLWVKEKKLERVLIIGMDSWLDGVSLEYLQEAQRLKSEENPRGLMPGEAAGALLLEKSEALFKRKGKALASVLNYKLEMEKDNFFEGKKSFGRAVSKVVKKVLSKDLERHPFKGDIYIDLNGENWRSIEYGSAKTQIPRDLIDDYSEVIPADSIGDTGAASGLISIALAVRSFERGYSKASKSLIISSSPSGNVGALLIKEAKND